MQHFYQLTKYNETDNVAEFECGGVSPAILKGMGSFAGDALHFQRPEGRVIGSVVGLDIDQHRNRALVKAKITEEETRNFLAAGVLTGLFMSDSGELSVCDRPVSKVATFAFQGHSFQLTKSFKPSDFERDRIAKREALVEKYTKRSSDFIPYLTNQRIRLHANASDRNGLSRAQNEILYRVGKALKAQQQPGRRLNRNAAILNKE